MDGPETNDTLISNLRILSCSPFLTATPFAAVLNNESNIIFFTGLNKNKPLTPQKQRIIKEMFDQHVYLPYKVKFI